MCLRRPCCVTLQGGLGVLRLLQVSRSRVLQLSPHALQLSLYYNSHLTCCNSRLRYAWRKGGQIVGKQREQMAREDKRGHERR